MNRSDPSAEVSHSVNLQVCLPAAAEDDDAEDDDGMKMMKILMMKIMVIKMMMM